MNNRFNLMTAIVFGALVVASPLSISQAKGVDGGKSGASAETGSKAGGAGEKGGKAGGAGEAGTKAARRG
jgi:hypothetical protein